MTLLYFSWVRQKLGTSQETLALPAGVSTVADLADFLRARGGGYEEVFSAPSRLRVAVNQDHVGFDAVLSDRDEVAFFPPVTGG